MKALRNISRNYTRNKGELRFWIDTIRTQDTRIIFNTEDCLSKPNWVSVGPGRARSRFCSSLCLKIT